MPVDLIRYDLLAQDALRGVVKKVLADVAARGLPGEHHFFITFNTRADGVSISDRLREKYPEEMTIVLQHQFWDLIVHDDRFDVGVSFNGIPERLSVPYAAIKGFFDPSVQFGLQFELAEAKAPEKDAAQDTAPATDAIPHGGATRPAPRGAASEPEETRPARSSVPATGKKPAASTPAEPAPPPDDQPGGAEVVRLDKFRKK
ncbi:MAG: Stringent starvation protein B [Bradyrhizobiaceae bacterium]|nr:Stringent starvation protein B [Bradyrhizobiaceae bacterium]